jgi:single-stranded-DNA-specific exonuclease
LANLLPVSGLKNAGAMAVLLADAIAANKKLLIVADYDADGATACAVAVRGLRLFGAQVDFIVPNRFEYGYGLTPAIVRLAALESPDIIITVDNGIASVDGLAEANRIGIQVWSPTIICPAMPCLMRRVSSIPTSPIAPSPAKTWQAWA